MSSKSEAEFTRALQLVRDLAVAQEGIVKKEQIDELFEGHKLDENQMSLVYDYLSKHGVGVDAPAEMPEDITEEDRNYLEMYLEDVGRLPQYSEGQKEAFCIGAMAGDAEAKKHLTEAFLQNVIDISKLYTGQGVSVEELICEGNLALVSGVEMLGALEKPSEVQGTLAKLVMDSMERIIGENADFKNKIILREDRDEET